MIASPIHSYPYDWRNPIGYFFADIWLYISILNELGFLACFTPLAVSFLIYAISLTKDWKHDLQALKKLANDVELYKDLSEFIRSHAYVKKLSETQTIGN